MPCRTRRGAIPIGQRGLERLVGIVGTQRDESQTLLAIHTDVERLRGADLMEEIGGTDLGKRAQEIPVDEIGGTAVLYG